MATAELSVVFSDVSPPSRTYGQPGQPLHRIQEVRRLQGMSLRTAARQLGTDIRSMDLRGVDGKVTGAMVVEVENLAHLEKIMKAARRVKGVSEVARRERITTAE